MGEVGGTTDISRMQWFTHQDQASSVPQWQKERMQKKTIHAHGASRILGAIVISASRRAQNSAILQRILR
jgi:hypothetical protein